ncbi:hypothetical protein Theba_1765 [Mesotoga prima MesG1.Ag.4.2]|uniref:Uncharacterized protein n=2 Tax=Mesotoga prima TaxID=1184387 RepID=I2F668_9BACT|nr:MULTISPECIES: hypothetical protein [Mesotoga]AFK07358.1 hypothetical protein Theba_1698 [Mesotoga prima MesG1.Ag.4.2]AFK07421.1 hypothetical protein Theba_1765 [Mesotoga prima MesG1.Ag.4.2]HQC14002.1 hypothetical protein [Mesotoga prima]
MTGCDVFEKADNCHPELVSGSALLKTASGSEVGKANETGLPFNGSPFSEENLFFVPERGSVLHALSKDGFMVLDEGPTVALYSAQRVFTLKRTAILRIEMLKQVQMTPRKGFRLQDRGLVNRTGLPIQGFAANEVVIQTAVLGSPSNCHPELVSGSGRRPHY